jgi:hypothetical protein
VVAILITAQMLAFVVWQAAACVLVSIDGRLAKDTEERPIAALR